MLYGRRRVGKTALLRHWVEQSGQRFSYWIAEKDPAPLQRRKFFAEFLRSIGSALPVPDFDSWSELWQSMAEQIGTRRHLVVLDEIPYAAEADPAMLSALQHAWDRDFQHSNVVLALSGSHVRTMEMLLAGQSPLFGRMTGQWRLQPLPFGTLRLFLPQWTPEEQVAAYAIVGGVPAYLAWLDSDRSLAESIRTLMLAPGSVALSEVEFLLSDEVREPRSYLAILHAIGNGSHTLREIADASMISTSHLSFYLAQLQELRLVERRLPATIPAVRQRISRQGRYHLSDPFLRFYFRFLQPHASNLVYQPERIIPLLQSGLRAFVGQTAWEELARIWVAEQGRAGALSFVPDVIGSHWSKRVQVDVVAINWQQHALLLGECKWGTDAVDKQTVRELIEHKTPLVLVDLPNGGQGWSVEHVLFARRGLTPAARDELMKDGGWVVDLITLYNDLA